ncbi:MAG: PIN domain-containing protein [Bacillota bacterium]|nr:PIN domain-containing protein [Bacillota bacterium]
MLSRVFRALFTLAGMLFGYGVSTFLVSENVLGRFWDFNSGEIMLATIFFVGLFGIIFFYLFSRLRKFTNKTVTNIEGTLSKVPGVELFAGAIGLLLGLSIAYLISQILMGIKILQTAYISTILSAILYVLFAYVCSTLTRRLASKFDFSSFQRFQTIQTVKSKANNNASAPKILDTSVIIDGRVFDILKTGFLEGNIIIPEFVLVELRHIADSSDSLKRNRGRRGLDVLNKIQTEYGIEIYNTSSEKGLDEIPEVDVKLLKLAQIMKGVVVTNDFNLNKVASIQGVPVLNINELANAIKPVVIPGEDMEVFVVKEGKENNQGIAYLDDGTMIVVENGKKLIGKTINSTVTSVLQTAAGRMIFVKPN